MVWGGSMKKNKVPFLLYVGVLVIIFLVAYYLYGCAPAQQSPPTSAVHMSSLEDDAQTDVPELAGALPENPHIDSSESAGFMSENPYAEQEAVTEEESESEPTPEYRHHINVPAGWVLGFHSVGDSFDLFGPYRSMVNVRMLPTGDRIAISSVYDIHTAQGIVQQYPFGYVAYEPAQERWSEERLTVEHIQLSDCSYCDYYFVLILNWPISNEVARRIQTRLESLDASLRSGGVTIQR
jgi:hypothetical protein